MKREYVVWEPYSESFTWFEKSDDAWEYAKKVGIESPDHPVLLLQQLAHYGPDILK